MDQIKLLKKKTYTLSFNFIIDKFLYEIIEGNTFYGNALKETVRTYPQLKQIIELRIFRRQPELCVMTQKSLVKVMNVKFQNIFNSYFKFFLKPKEFVSDNLPDITVAFSIYLKWLIFIMGKFYPSEASLSLHTKEYSLIET